MAVVESYYGVKRNPGQVALVAWLEAFVSEREAMNKDILAQRLRESGADDTELLDMEVQLRKQAAQLERAKAEAVQGNFKAAADLAGDWTGYLGRVESARLAGEAGIIRERERQSGETRRTYIEAQADTNRRLRAYDPEVARLARMAVDETQGSDAALFAALQGELRKVEDRVSRDGLLLDLLAEMRVAGKDDLADRISDRFFDTENEREYEERTYPANTEEDLDRRSRRFGGQLSPPSPLYSAVAADQQAKLAEPEKVTERTSTTTAGPVGTPGAATTASAAAPGGPGVTGISAKGDASQIGALLGYLHLNPDATNEEIVAALNKGIEQLNKEAGEIAKYRSQKARPMFRGNANYILDNPNWTRDDKAWDRVVKVASRRREVAEEFGNEPGTDRQAIRAMNERGFDPDVPFPFATDDLVLGGSPTANVYAYFADMIEQGQIQTMEDEMERMPARSLAVLKPLLDLGMENPDAAVKQLRQLAEEDDVTLLDIAADAVEAAAKDQTKIGELASLAATVDPDDEPWAAAVNRAIDKAWKGGDREELRATLSRIANGMRRGREAQGRAERADAKEAMERVAGAKVPPAPADTAAVKSKAEEDEGRRIARATFKAWQTEGYGRPAMDAKIGSITADTPRMRAMKDELTSLVGKPIPERAEDVWKSKAPEQPEDMRRPSPKVREEYRKQMGLPPEKSMEEYQPPAGLDYSKADALLGEEDDLDVSTGAVPSKPKAKKAPTLDYDAAAQELLGDLDVSTGAVPSKPKAKKAPTLDYDAAAQELLGEDG